MKSFFYPSAKGIVIAKASVWMDGWVFFFVQLVFCNYIRTQSVLLCRYVPGIDCATTRTFLSVTLYLCAAALFLGQLAMLRGSVFSKHYFLYETSTSI